MDGLIGPGLVSEQTKWVLLAGFMGAFTTFATFAFETGRHMSQGLYGAAALNVLANNVLGIGAFFLGWWVAGRVG